MKTRFICLFLTFFCSTYLLLAQCNYLAYEPFNYTANTALQGLNGGSGWREAWLTQGENTTVPGYSVVANNLTYGALQI